MLSFVSPELAPRPALGMTPVPRLEQRVVPAQLLLSELLSLTAAELEGRLQIELDRNGALELPDAPLCGCGCPAWSGRCGACRDPRDVAPPKPRGEPAAPVDAWADLLSGVGLRPAERPVAALLLADLDQHGVLGDPAMAAARLGLPVEVVGRVVAALRAAGGAGLGAATLAERLALQAGAASGEAGVPAPVRALLATGLDALVAGGPSAAAERSGLSCDEVGDALAWLRGNLAADVVPRPVPAPPRTVDVVVGRSDGHLHVEVVAGPWSVLRIAPSYLAAADHPAVRADVARARGLLDALSRRERTLHRVCEAAITHQIALLDDGPAALRPLSRRELATRLGLHESTVGRAVQGKDVALPRGTTVALSELFASGCAVRRCLQEIISADGASLSDRDLVCALATRGHAVARRTVAKYRAELGLPDRRRRRATAIRTADDPATHRT